MIINIEYEFVSVKADGDNYCRVLRVVAKDTRSAMSIAKIEGFKAFGARFTDNCIDWRVKQ